MYLLDTNVVSELRRPRPHPAVLNWIADVPAEQLFVSAVTVGEIQAGIEITREQDTAKAHDLEAWLDKVLASYGVLPMDAPPFREWARLIPNPPNRVVGALEWDMGGMETRSSGRIWGRPGQWLPAMVVWQCSWRDRRQQEAPAGPAGTSWGDLRSIGWRVRVWWW